jgi:ABC-type transport system substrate-binding protein
MRNPLPSPVHHHGLAVGLLTSGGSDTGDTSGSGSAVVMGMSDDVPATDAELAAIAKQFNDSGLFDATVKSVAFDQYEKDIAAGKYGVYVKGWVPDDPDPDNFTRPFSGDGNVLGSDYTNKTITGALIPQTAAESERSATEQEYAELRTSSPRTSR